MSECLAKHTAYQPTDEEWRCPKCGADNKRFVIAESEEGADDACPQLHERDVIVCDDERGTAHYETTGKRFAALLAKLHNLVPCPHCKGNGLVPGKAAR